MGDPRELGPIVIRRRSGEPADPSPSQPGSGSTPDPSTDPTMAPDPMDDLANTPVAEGLGRGNSDHVTEHRTQVNPTRPAEGRRKQKHEVGRNGTAEEIQRAKDIVALVEAELQQIAQVRDEDSRPEDFGDYSLAEVIAHCKEAFFSNNVQSPEDYVQSRNMIEYINTQVRAAHARLEASRQAYRDFIAQKSDAGSIAVKTSEGKRNLEYLVGKKVERKFYKQVEQAVRNMKEWFSGHVTTVEQQIADQARRTSAKQEISELVDFLRNGLTDVPTDIQHAISNLLLDVGAITKFVQEHAGAAVNADIDMSYLDRQLHSLLGDPISAVTDSKGQPIDPHTTQLTYGSGLERTIRNLRAMAEPRQWKNPDGKWNVDRKNPVDNVRDKVAELYTLPLVQKLDEAITVAHMSPDQEYGFWLWWLDKADDTVDRKQYKKSVERGTALREQLGMTFVGEDGRRRYDPNVIKKFRDEAVEQCRFVGELRAMMRPIGGMVGQEVRKEFSSRLGRYSTEDKLAYAKQFKEAIQVEQVALLRSQSATITELVKTVHSQAMSDVEDPVKFTAEDVMESLFGKDWAKSDVSALTKEFTSKHLKNRAGTIIGQAGKTNEALRDRLKAELVQKIGVGALVPQTNVLQINEERIQRIVANIAEGAKQKAIFEYSLTGITSEKAQAKTAEYNSAIEHVFVAHPELATAINTTINAYSPEDMTPKQRTVILNRFRQLAAVYRDSNVDWAIMIGLVRRTEVASATDPKAEPILTVDTDAVQAIVGEIMDDNEGSAADTFGIEGKDLLLAVSDTSKFSGLSVQLESIGVSQKNHEAIIQKFVIAALQSAIATAPEADYSLKKVLDAALSKLAVRRNGSESASTLFAKFDLLDGKNIDMTKLAEFMDSAYLDDDQVADSVE